MSDEKQPETNEPEADTASGGAPEEPDAPLRDK